jgi:hypothetical protein
MRYTRSTSERFTAAQVVVRGRFLDLPGEIRNLIYDFICPDEHEDFRDSDHNFWIGSLRELLSHYKDKKGLTQTCKQIRKEMLSRCSIQATWRAIFNVPECFAFPYEITWPNGNRTDWNIMPGDIRKLYLEIHIGPNGGLVFHIDVERNVRMKSLALDAASRSVFFTVSEHCIVWPQPGVTDNRTLMPMADGMRPIIARHNDGADGLAVDGWREVIESAKDIATNQPWLIRGFSKKPPLWVRREAWPNRYFLH